MFKLPCSSRERQSALGNGITRASLVAQTVKHLPAMRETWVQSLGQEDPWRRKWQPTPVLMDGKAWWATVHGVAKSQTRLSNFT